MQCSLYSTILYDNTEIERQPRYGCIDMDKFEVADFQVGKIGVADLHEIGLTCAVFCCKSFWCAGWSRVIVG